MSPPLLVVPPEGEGMDVIASVSGGKDSTALILALLEAQIPARFVFADTGWEADQTYVYLEFLEKLLGITIARVGVEGGMIARVRHRAGFSGRMQRWCTRELKIQPLRAFHDRVEQETGHETICAMGVRAAESERRAKMPEWEDEGPKYTRERWGGWVWRPLIRWTVDDVLMIHRRFAVPVNPLYHLGHDRVGCYPCIFENKDGIRLVQQHAPSRIELIRSLEQEMTELRRQRNVEKPGRYKHEDAATFFQTQRQGFSGIDKVVEWANTDYGGRQFQLFGPAPTGGCMRWGQCGMPVAPEEAVAVANDALQEGRADTALDINRMTLADMLARKAAK